MQKILLLSCLSLLCATLIANDPPSKWTEGFAVGNPGIQSINAMSFGPENILFIGDATAAQIVALDLGSQGALEGEIEMTGVDKTLSFLLGTTPDQIRITDMAVHPESKQVFLSVEHGAGNVLLFRYAGKSFESVPLDAVNHMAMTLPFPIAEDATDRRGRPIRHYAISDLQYTDGQIMVTGLSNKEFGSTFRSIAFPFNGRQTAASLEVYHAAHGQWETRAPIKTFTPIELDGAPHILAGYTCTPLVVFGQDQLKPGAHTKGKTLAELGSWNSPLDIIELANEGKRYVLIANSSRALMKIKVDDIVAFQEGLTSRVEERSGTAGVDFIALPFVNVLQLAKLSNDSFVMLQRKSDGDLVLSTGGKRWL